MATYCEHCASWHCFKANDVTNQSHYYAQSFVDFMRSVPFPYFREDNTYGSQQHVNQWEEQTGKKLHQVIGGYAG